MNTPGFGAVLFKACEELGVTCQTEQLVIPYTVMWKREVTECSMSSDTQVGQTEQQVIPYTVMWKREVTECSMSSETQVDYMH